MPLLIGKVIFYTKEEQKKYDVIKKVVEGVLTRQEASNELDITKKQINRLKVRYKLEGEKGFIHK